MMKTCEQRGRDFLNLNVTTAVGLSDWLRARENSHETISLGLPSYSLLCTVLQSIKAGAGGLLLGSVESNQHNRPHHRLLDWFFHLVLVLKMTEEELRFLEKLTLFVGNAASASGWDNGAEMPQDPVRLTQIHAIREPCLIYMIYIHFSTTVTFSFSSVHVLYGLYSFQYNRYIQFFSSCSSKKTFQIFVVCFSPLVLTVIQARREAAHRVLHRAGWLMQIIGVESIGFILQNNTARRVISEAISV